MKLLLIGKNYSQALKTTDSTSLLSIAEAMGYHIVRYLDEQPDYVICVDYARSDMNVIRKAKRLGIPSILIINEPEVVLPLSSRKSVRKAFDKVLEIGRPNTVHNLRWAQTWRAISLNDDRIKSAIMVNSDKWSFIEGNLYWLRAALAMNSHRVDVCGQGWERRNSVRLAHRVYEFIRTIASLRIPTFRGIRFIMGKPISFQGTVLDKVEKMSKYRVAIVIENSRDLLTEKLFDAWFAGCIPVYVGPSISEFGIPEDLVVQSEPELTCLERAIDYALSVDRDIFLQSLQIFLDTPSALEWQSENAIQRALLVATGSV